MGWRIVCNLTQNDKYNYVLKKKKKKKKKKKLAICDVRVLLSFSKKKKNTGLTKNHN
jgi:hypothetical protein